MPSIKTFSSYPGSLNGRPIPPRRSAIPLFIHFLPFSPTLNLLLDPFNHLPARTGLQQGPVTSSAQVNLSSQFFTKLNFALINNAHPLLPYEDRLHWLGASLFRRCYSLTGAVPPLNHRFHLITSPHCNALRGSGRGGGTSGRGLVYPCKQVQHVLGIEHCSRAAEGEGEKKWGVIGEEQRPGTRTGAGELIY